MSFTTSIVALIFKVENAQHFSNYRPISSCQVCYKFISKILTTKLATFMPKIIFLAQGGFVQGRNITNSITLASEMCHNLGKKIRGSNVFFSR